MQQPSSASASRRSSYTRERAPIAAPDDAMPPNHAAAASYAEPARHSETGSTAGAPQRTAAARGASLLLHELASSQASVPGSSRASAPLAPPSRRRVPAPEHEDQSVCACSSFHSLRCCTKLHALLHRQVELDASAVAAAAKRAADAAARAAKERRQLRDLFGDDLPPDPAPAATITQPQPEDEWSAQVPAASLRLHQSDFTLGNLKNQATRVVLPPTIVFSPPPPPRPQGPSFASSSAAPPPPPAPVSYFFTSQQTGSILRKSQEKVSPARVLDDLLQFARRNMGQALAALGKHEQQARKVREREEGQMSHRSASTTRTRTPRHTARQEDFVPVDFGFDGPGDGYTAVSSVPAVPLPATLPNYMRSTRPPSSKSPLYLSSVAVAAATARPSRSGSRPGSAASGRGGQMQQQRAIRAQHPLTSSPSSQPQQHCDIIAQFTFASDAPRFDASLLPYAIPGAVSPPSGEPIPPPPVQDILYLSARSLHHFLTAVNGDFHSPLAAGVLQPFVLPREEHNTVYRVSFTALPSTEGGTTVSAARVGETTGLPPAWHVSVEARQNVLKLNDHTGLAAAAAAAAAASSSSSSALQRTPQQFSLAERAVTFDASHLSLQVDAVSAAATSRRPASATLAQRYGSVSSALDEESRAIAGKSHVLYPRVDPALASSPLSSTPSPVSANRTLVVPSGFPFAPSATTAARRLRVSIATQERLQVCMLRMVAHLNALSRATPGSSAAAVPDPSISISVGFLEAFFKIDCNNNLFLLTATSIKHIVSTESQSEQKRAEQEGSTEEQTEQMVRCVQCLKRCVAITDPLALKQDGDITPGLLRPTSATLAAAQHDREQRKRDAIDASMVDSNGVPFYARQRRSDQEEEAAERAARARRLSGTGVRSSATSKSHPDLSASTPSLDDSYERDLWPDSHFNPPAAPVDRFSVPAHMSVTAPTSVARERERPSFLSEEEEAEALALAMARMRPEEEEAKEEHTVDGEGPIPATVHKHRPSSAASALRNVAAVQHRDILAAAAAAAFSGTSSSAAVSSARLVRPSTARTAAVLTAAPKRPSSAVLARRYNVDVSLLKSVGARTQAATSGRGSRTPRDRAEKQAQGQRGAPRTHDSSSAGATVPPTVDPVRVYDVFASSASETERAKLALLYPQPDECPPDSSRTQPHATYSAFSDEEVETEEAVGTDALEVSGDFSVEIEEGQA